MAEIKSGKITVTQAAGYLDDVKDQKLKDQFKKSATGIFPASIFNAWRFIPNFSGIMFWYCEGPFQKVGGNVLHLVAEPKYNFTYINDSAFVSQLKPESKKLLMPLEIRGKELHGTNGKFIMESEIGRPQVVADWKDNQNVITETTEFLDNFSNLNTYAFGYLEAVSVSPFEDYFENLLGETNQSPEFIRYYFGFDDSSLPCKIRFYLTPVNSAGQNILRMSSGTDSYLLQRSWPPPPNT